jgi:hypothetical protein
VQIAPEAHVHTGSEPVQANPEVPPPSPVPPPGVDVEVLPHAARRAETRKEAKQRNMGA